MLGKITQFTGLVLGATAFELITEAPQPTRIFQEEPESLISATGTYPCVFKLGSAFYDYTPFKLASETWAATDSTDQTTIYQFGWCQILSEAEGATCLSDTYAAKYNTAEPTQCTDLSNDNPKDDIVASAITSSVQYTNGTVTELSGVALTYLNGEMCTDSVPSVPYQFTINVYCDPSLKGADSDFKAYGTKCAPYVNVISKQGCEIFSANIFWEFLAEYEMYWGAALIAAGFLLCFFGSYLIKPSVCIAGFLTVIFLSCALFYTIWFSTDDELKTFWIVLGCSAAGGIIIGLLLARFVRVGAAILAGWGGFALGMILNEMVLSRIGEQWIFWTSLVLCVLIAAALTFWFYDHIVILTTVSLGAYGMMRGTSLYAGHYYNEFTMATMIADGLLDEIDPWYWAYIGGFVLMYFIGCCVQYRSLRNWRRAKSVEKHPFHG